MTSMAGSFGLGRQMVVPRSPVRHAPQVSLGQLLPPCLLFAALLMQLGIRVVLIERGYRLETIRHEALKRDTELRTLRADWAQRTRPKELAVQAQDRLGMRLLSPERVRRCEESNEVAR